MPSPLFLIYPLLAFLTGFSDTLPTTSPTALFSLYPLANKTWPALPPLPPPTTFSELTTSRSILLSLLHKSLPHVHPRSKPNSTTTHILCDPSPTSADLIDVLAGTNWFLRQGDHKFLQTEEYQEILQWGTAGFSVYSPPLTYAYPYRTLGLMAGAIARECKLDSSVLAREGGRGGEGGAGVSGRFVHVEEYADLRIFRKAFYREDWV